MVIISHICDCKVILSLLFPPIFTFHTFSLCDFAVEFIIYEIDAPIWSIVVAPYILGLLELSFGIILLELSLQWNEKKTSWHTYHCSEGM